MTDCHAFFNCEAVTGHPYPDCPNRETCKNISIPRSCPVPWQRARDYNCGGELTYTLVCTAIHPSASEYGYATAEFLRNK